MRLAVTTAHRLGGIPLLSDHLHVIRGFGGIAAVRGGKPGSKKGSVGKGSGGKGSNASKGGGKGGKGSRLSRAARVIHPPGPAPAPYKPPEGPLARPTGSPWVWASTNVGVTEEPPVVGASLRVADDFFVKNSAKARFVPPAEFEYELPSHNVPEIAFAGRSNVGKSSLLAALLARPAGLVRISKTPGCTSSVNYFALGPNLGTPGKESQAALPFGGAMDQATDLYLVDLPGYGFAKRSSDEQDQFSRLLTHYLGLRGMLVLRRVLVLVDSRHGPTPDDWRLMEQLSVNNVSFQIVLTKADAVASVGSASGGKDEIYARVCQLFDELRQWKKIRPTHMPLVHAVSSKTGDGIPELRLAIAQAAGIKSTNL